MSRVARGGARAHDNYNDDDDAYDVYDAYDQDFYDDEDEVEEQRGARRPLPSQTSTTKTARMPQRDLAASFKENRLFPSKQPKPSNSHWTKQIASTTWKLGRSLAVGSVQQTTRLAYQLVRPRKVQPQELNGLWRLDQQITLPKGGDVASVATIQLNARTQTVSVTVPVQGNVTRNTTTPTSTASITLSTETISAPYSLDKTRWKSFRTEFVLPAFSIRGRPRLYGYRGYWQRKLADPTVIKLVGKIHVVHKQRRPRGRGTDYVFGQAIGTFVARRRLRLLPSDRVKEESGGGVEEDDDEYDGEGDPIQEEDEDRSTPRQEFDVNDDDEEDDWDETEMDDDE